MAAPDVVLSTADQWDWWSSKAAWTSGILTLAAAVFALISLALHEHAQTKRRTDELSALRAEGKDHPLWDQSKKELETTFTRHNLPDGLVLYERQPQAVGIPLVEAVIQRDGKTIAVADIVALDASNAWEWASSTVMVDGSTIDEAVTRSDIPRWLAQRSNDGLDVIGVGIASKASAPAKPATNDSEVAQVNLVAKRAAQFATQLRRVAGFVTSRPVQYWTLELGTAKTARLRDSAEERRQRAAILVALSRRLSAATGAITPEKALALITTNVTVYGTDLTDFQNSNTPASFLKPLPAD